MGFPKIRVADGSVDCVNVVFEGVELAEVESTLRRNGWKRPYMRNVAYLEGLPPVLEMQWPVLDELVRFHLRLFAYDNLYVGNTHLDVVEFVRRIHKPFHNLGRDLLVGLFLRHGYAVEFVATEPCADFDGVVAKIYKKGRRADI